MTLSPPRAEPTRPITEAEFLSLSLIEQLSLLPEAEREEALSSLTEDEMASFDLWGRPRQLEVVHSTAWLTAYVAGRGAGKSRTGAHWVIEKAKTPGTRIALVGRTVADVRDVMVSGESGILNVSPPSFMPEYVPSVRKLVWPNGSLATTFSAEQPDQLRGPQHHYAWADEVATFRDKPDSSGLTIWDQILISTRLGVKPQILATTTPKRTQMMRDLFRRAAEEPDRIKIVAGSTMENRANLSPEYVQHMLDLYAGTALERQELHGEMLSIVEGALWRDDDFVIQQVPTLDELIDSGRSSQLQTVISVDPGASATGDATGIVVVTASLEPDLRDRRAWIREDHTIQGEPEEWAGLVADAWKRHRDMCPVPGMNEPIVVAEQNQGGAMIRAVIQQVDPAIPVALVPAIRSKAQRAEPVVLAYRQKRVFHTDVLEDLVDELTSWEPDSKWSPNRMDALVHGVRALLVDPRPLYPFGHLTVGTATLTSHIESAVPPHRRERRSGATGSGGGLRVAPWRQRTGY